jgi:hypothetical protein
LRAIEEQCKKRRIGKMPIKQEIMAILENRPEDFYDNS